MIKSMEEIKLARRLARKSMREGRNIAKTLSMEFLLWVAATTSIDRAIKEYGKEGIKHKRLRKKATPLEIERISLSRL